MASYVINSHSVALFRCMYVLLFVAFAYYHHTLSWWVATAWAHMRTSVIVRHDSFEPLVASVAFATWINMFRVWDRCCPRLHKYRLAGPTVKPDTFVGLDHGMQALTAYLAPLLVFDLVFKRRQLPETAPSAGGLVLQVIASVTAYDFVFFWVHVALHKFRRLAPLHARHHTKSPMNASEVVRHGLIDGSLQVLCNIVVLNALRCHPMARMLHNIVITYMLTETHSGYDMPWMLHNVVPFHILGGSPRHEAHHRVGNKYFQQFYTYLDDWWMGGKPSAEPFAHSPTAGNSTANVAAIPSTYKDVVDAALCVPAN